MIMQPDWSPFMAPKPMHVRCTVAISHSNILVKDEILWRDSVDWRLPWNHN